VFTTITIYDKKIKPKDFKRIPKTTLWLKKMLIFGLLLYVLWFISIVFIRLILGKGYYKYYPLWIDISI